MALPLDCYIRVSQVAGRKGDRFQSPGAQRSSIEGWAKAHGVKIAMIHEDLDRSGGTMDRPGMNEALRRIETGVSGGLVVARLDRFARTVIGGLTTIHELHKRGARVVSVAENLDPATPMGRAMLGLLLIMAEWQRDQADEHLASAQIRAASAGRFPGRKAYGYMHDEDGRTIVNTDTAPVVQRIFRERAAGVGWRKIADDLITDQILSPRGRELWAPSTISGLIRTEAYLGTFIGPRGMRVEEAWPAIVDQDLWNRANAVRGTRDNTRRHHDRLLAGLARCASCRQVLKRAVNPEGYVSYACLTRGCKERGSIGAQLLDKWATDLVNERLARVALAPTPADDDGEADRLIAARDAAVTELEVWRDDLELRTALGDQDWREGMLARARARDDAEVDLAEHRARTEVGVDLPGDIIPSLDELPWEVRRRVVEALVHSVWMRPSKVRGPGARHRVAERLKMVWRDDRDRPETPSGFGDVAGPLRW